MAGPAPEARGLAVGGQTFNMGGGAPGTQYKNIGAPGLPTVPSTRSMPAIPVAGNLASMPWRDKPLAAMSTTPTDKAGKKGPGFVVRPLMSQERMAAGGFTAPPPPQ